MDQQAKGPRMFENLSDRLSGVFDRLTKQGALSEDDVKTALREVRVALLEADVSLPVARDFVNTFEVIRATRGLQVRDCTRSGRFEHETPAAVTGRSTAGAGGEVRGGEIVLGVSAALMSRKHGKVAM